MTNDQQLLIIILAVSIPSLLLLIAIETSRIGGELRKLRKSYEQIEQLIKLCTRTANNVPERPK